MKQDRIVQALLWAFIAFGLAFAIVMLTGALRADASFDGLQTITTGTTDDGGVSVALTPRGIADGVLSFDISINTHSVDLSGVDLARAAVLEYGATAVAPIAAPVMRGHHVDGTLSFPVGRVPSSFTVRVAGIPKERERVYRW